MINLDSLAFKKAMEIYSDNEIENDKLKIELEKAIGVLSSQGIFATYLLLNKEKKIKYIINHLKNLLQEIFNKRYNNFEHAITEIANNLDNLIVAKQCIEQTFIYLRYKLKGEPKDNEN